MQVTVYGASGKVGRLVVAELLTHGHTVVAFVHRINRFNGQYGVTVATGSIEDQVAVASAMAGSQAAISTLGSWGSATKTVVSTGTGAIIAAALQHGVQRVITVTGAGASSKNDRPTRLDTLTHAFLNLTAPKILKDGETHLQLLEASALDWTVVRSPIMVGSGSNSYVLSHRLPSLLATIPRRAVAKAIVDQLTDSKYFQQAPVIRRG